MQKSRAQEREGGSFAALTTACECAAAANVIGQQFFYDLVERAIVAVVDDARPHRRGGGEDGVHGSCRGIENLFRRGMDYRG